MTTPLVEPRSRTTQPRGVGRTSAWRADTVSSASTRSASGSQPMTIGCSDDSSSGSPRDGPRATRSRARRTATTRPVGRLKIRVAVTQPA